MKYTVAFSTNTGNDDFKKTFESYDEVICEIGDMLKEVYDEYERKYPDCEIRWTNRFWGDMLMTDSVVTTEIYVAGQDDNCSCTIMEVGEEEPNSFTFIGRRDPYKVAQIVKITNAPELYAYLSGDKTSGAKTINLDEDVLEIIKVFYEGKKIVVEEVS